jgi:hypothetical protein
VYSVYYSGTFDAVAAKIQLFCRKCLRQKKRIAAAAAKQAARESAAKWILRVAFRKCLRQRKRKNRLESKQVAAATELSLPALRAVTVKNLDKCGTAGVVGEVCVLGSGGSGDDICFLKEEASKDIAKNAVSKKVYLQLRLDKGSCRIVFGDVFTKGDRMFAIMGFTISSGEGSEVVSIHCYTYDKSSTAYADEILSVQDMLSILKSSDKAGYVQKCDCFSGKKRSGFFCRVKAYPFPNGKRLKRKVTAISRYTSNSDSANPPSSVPLSKVPKTTVKVDLPPTPPSPPLNKIKAVSNGSRARGRPRSAAATVATKEAVALLLKANEAATAVIDANKINEKVLVEIKMQMEKTTAINNQQYVPPAAPSNQSDQQAYQSDQEAFAAHAHKNRLRDIEIKTLELQLKTQGDLSVHKMAMEQQNMLLKGLCSKKEAVLEHVSNIMMYICVYHEVAFIYAICYSMINFMR